MLLETWKSTEVSEFATPKVVIGGMGAIGSAGDWSMKRACAVVLTDVGKGVGLYDLTDDTVNRIDGTRATRTAAGALNFFAAKITNAARTAYNALFPNRLALKKVGCPCPAPLAAARCLSLRLVSKARCLISRAGRRRIFPVRGR